jgi:hypothetical protein
MNSPWVVRRIRTEDGRDLPRPHLWGRVFASSASVAVSKFINTLAVGTYDARQFDAVPDKERA